MIDLSINGMVAMLTAVIAIFAAAVLASAQWQNLERPWWLIIFLLCLAGLKSTPVLFETDWVSGQPGSLIALATIVFCIGPSLLLYTTRLTGQRFKTRDLVHLLPPAAGLLLGIAAYFQYLDVLAASPENDLRALFTAPPAAWVGWILMATFLAYAMLCWRQIQHMETGLRDQFSQASRVRLTWLRRLSVGLVLIVAVDVATGLLGQLLSLQGSWLRVVPNFFVSLYVIALSFGALRQPLIHLDSEQPSRYASSGLGEETLTIYANRLENLMTSARPYLENELNLSQLAEPLNIKPHHLSQVLNEKIGQSFYDYINSFRIAEARTLLENTDQTVTEISFAVGYNNKVSFYKAFKQATGTTPVAFRNHSHTSRSKSHVT